MKISKFLLTVVALAFSFAALPASAHTVLASADPAINSTVISLPSTVSLTFADELVALGDSNSISITDKNRNELTSGKPEVSGAVLSINLEVSDATGVMKVEYRAVAADGHVIKGDYQFTVSPMTISETATRTSEEIAPTSESGNKISINLIISATLVVGGGLLLFFIWKRQSK
jgi:methionine-rich copper-binding protein CopC